MTPLSLLPQVALPDTTFDRFVRGLPTVESPLPGGVAMIFRTIFNAPAWMWVVAIAIGLLGAALLGKALYLHRVRVGAWLASQDRGLKFAMVGAVAVVLVVIGVTGTASWNYMQHENDFCSSCHVMEGPWNKFSQDAGKHSDLSCHDCHQQSIFTSSRQLVLWVANKPEKIPEHAPVPNTRCESCHNTKTDEQWTRVAETAGHRTHMESDSSALKDVQCVTCHGAEVHAFVPASRTCGQSGCHEDTDIKLGKMADQTALHCNQCHQYTAEVPLLATRDSAAGTMRPGKKECLACHEMERVISGYDPLREPHSSSCGTCHNPHSQETPQEAGKTCTTSGCHANWEETPFHTGTSHKRVGESCLTCHEHHASKVDPSDCVACHTRVRDAYEPGQIRLPPLPFDTTRVLRLGSTIPGAWLHETGQGKGDVRPPDLPPSVRPAELQPAVADTFSHPRHTSIACITCHVSPNVQRGGSLTFEQPRGCQICHHQASERENCAACHAPATIAAARPATLTVTTPSEPPRERAVVFLHPTHAGVRCADCHTTPVSLAAKAEASRCTDCHGDHHTAGLQCKDCHTTPQVRTAHEADVAASHRRCDACHTAATVARLTPDRTFCLTCHLPEEDDHYPARECTTCHLLASPAEYRPQLLGGASP